MERSVAPERVEALESSLRKVQGRLDGLERAARNMEGELTEMRARIISIESSVQEMLAIFRGLSERVAAQGRSRPAEREGGKGPEALSPGDEVVREAGRGGDDG